MPNIGLTEILLILLIVLILFGARKLPDLARAIGKSMKELKNGMKDEGENKSGSAESEDK
jgi:sec-independent protein translocase protein TatA